MLSTCGDKRLLSSCLSPHRICSLVCVREMTHWEAWHCEGGNDSAANNPDNTFTSSGPRSLESEHDRRNLYVAIYRLTQCAEATSKEEFLAELRDHHQCSSDYVDAIKLALKAIVDSPLDSLLELFVVLPELLNAEGHMTVSGTSPIGIYIRQSILAFNRLDFAQIEKVSRKLCDFIEPPASTINAANNFAKRYGASKSFVDAERSNGLHIEDQTVFLRNQPYAQVNEPNSAQVERQPDSYFSHHLNLMSQSFFLCSTDALVSYFSRNFKNRMPDIVVREPQGNFLMREMKSKSAICSSRFETILLGYVAGVSGDAAGCRSLLIDATKQCHSAGDVVGVELANLMSLLIFGIELTSPSVSQTANSMQALLDAPPPATPHTSSSSVPLTTEGLKYLAFVNFYKVVIDILRTDKKSAPVYTQIASLVNAYLPIVDRASPVEAAQLSLVLTQTISLIYRLHGELALATSFNLVTLYMNAEFTPGHFFGTAPVLRAWQDLALNNWSSQTTVTALWQKIDLIFPGQPDIGHQLVTLTSNFKVYLITGEFSTAESAVTQLSSVDKNEAAVLCASYLLETGQFYELDAHYNKIINDESNQQLPTLYRLRLDLIRGLYFIAINDCLQALEIFDRIINLCDVKASESSSESATTSYRHYGIKALVFLYKALVMLRLGFIPKARHLLLSKATILCRVYCSSFVVGQAYYLLGVAEALSHSFAAATTAFDNAISVLSQMDALPMLLQAFSTSAMVAQAKGETKARNVYAHKFLTSRQELSERDRVWVDSDVWKLSPFYFIDILTGSLRIVKH